MNAPKTNRKKIMRTSLGSPKESPLPADFRVITSLKPEAISCVTATQKIPIDEIRIPHVPGFPRGNSNVQENINNNLSNNGVAPTTSRENSVFSFERQKLMELGQEGIKRYEVEGPVTEVDKEDPRAVRIEKYNKTQIEAELENIKKWSTHLKFLCVTFIFWAVIEVAFSMIYTFVMALNNQVNLAGNTIPLIVNIAASVWMIYISLKGGSVTGNTEGMTRFLRLCIISLVAFAIQFTVMPLVMSIPRFFKSLKAYSDADNSERAFALMGLGYIVVWMSSMVNAIFCALYIGVTLLLRKLLLLKDLHELEQKTLPLGYQIYAKLPPNEQGNSVPYEV